MNLRTLSILVSIIFLSVLHISAQKQTEPVKVIEFSGIVFEKDKNGHSYTTSLYQCCCGKGQAEVHQQTIMVFSICGSCRRNYSIFQDWV
ncbi:MAG: hypothetical protein IPO37_19135 [Saprospiraceae bacterium]|nr:hypothetical protein [Saprospiraceae bacterium]